MTAGRTPAMVTPVLVDGTPIAHLATTALDGMGADYLPICPAGSMITRPLRLIRADEMWVWCPACREWAEAAGITLPRPGSS